MELQQKFANEQYSDTHYDITTLTPYAPVSECVVPGGMLNEFDWRGSAADTGPVMFTMSDRSDLTSFHSFLNYSQLPQNDIASPASFWQSPEVSAVHSSFSGYPFSPSDSGMSGSPESMQSVSPTASDTSCQKPKRKRVQTFPQRRAANIRERRRMFHLNDAFDSLRTKLPAFNYEKRLSRIETLRLAITYISFMKDVTTGKDPKQIRLKNCKELESELFAEMQENLAADSELSD